MFSANTFCSLTFSSIQINPGGDFKVCCFSGSHGNHGISKEDDGVVMNVMTHSVEEALNSKLHKQLRLFQSQNMRHPTCRVCWDRDDAAGQSHRTFRNQLMRRFDNAVRLEDAAAKMQKDGSIDSFPVLLDIRFGNLCNAKCIHCSPNYSNLWYGDHSKIHGDTFGVGPTRHKIYQENNVYKSDFIQTKWWETEHWWNEFERISNRLGYIYVTGGEPLIVPAHEEMLDRLIASGKCENISLEYDTNLSALNPKILTKIKKFKSVIIAVSFDDIEERYEIFRNPLKWDNLLRNLHLLKENYITPDEISCCVGIPTVYAPMRIIPLMEELGFHNYRLRLLRSPTVFDLKFLHEEEKKKILERYSLTNIGERNTIMTTGYIKNNMNSYDKGQLLGFVRYMDSLDKLRNHDWKSVMPDVAELVLNSIKRGIK